MENRPILTGIVLGVVILIVVRHLRRMRKPITANRGGHASTRARRAPEPAGQTGQAEQSPALAAQPTSV